MSDDTKTLLMEFLKALWVGPAPLILAAIVGCAIGDWTNKRKGKR